MTIRNTLPSDKRRPGVSHEFDTTSGSRSLVTIQRRIALVGIKSAGGQAVTATPIQAFNEEHADLLCGVGAELALMARAAFRTFVDMGVAAQVWLCGIAPPAGAAATGTFAITGPATESGDIVFSIAGRVFRAPVASGASATVAGDAMVNAVKEALAEVPGTVANVTGTVTYTHNHLGVNGNDVKLRLRSKPAGLAIVVTQPSGGSGAVDITAALDALQTQEYLDVAIANHAAADITDLLADAAATWAMTKKKWRHYHVGDNATLGAATTLATAANAFQILVHTYELSEAQPGVIAAAIAALLNTREAPNFNFNGTTLSAIPPIENLADAYIDTEVESALAGGTSPITVDDATGRAKVERIVTTKKTQGSNPFFDLLDVGHSKTIAFAARQVDVIAARLINGRSATDDLVKDVRTGVYEMLKDLEDLGYVHKVDEHAAELKAEKDPNVIGRILLEIPESIVPSAHQVHGVHRMFVGE